MKIVEKIQEISVKFKNIQEVITMRQQEINQLSDESKRLQGEYRLLIEMGKEAGVVDEEGNIIKENGTD